MDLLNHSLDEPSRITADENDQNLFLVQPSNKSKDSETDYISVQRAQGYGGPLTIGTLISKNGQIKKVTILDHNDTSAFIDILISKKLLEAFEEIQIQNGFNDINSVDGISGATFSSRAVRDTVLKSADHLSTRLFSKSYPRFDDPFTFDERTAMVGSLLCIAIICVYLKLNRLRIFVLTGSFILLGFYLNTQLTLTQFTGLLLGYFPGIQNDLWWYLLVCGTLLFTLLLRRNFYCYWICPFGACQELASKIGAPRIPLHSKIQQKAKLVRLLLLILFLMIAVLRKNPSIAGYEPFSLLFAQKGNNTQWIWFPALIFAFFFIPRIWCRYFCGVGLVLDWAAKLFSKVRTKTNQEPSPSNPGKSLKLKLSDFVSISILMFILVSILTKLF